MVGWSLDETYPPSPPEYRDRKGSTLSTTLPIRDRSGLGSYVKPGGKSCWITGVPPGKLMATPGVVEKLWYGCYCR